MAKCKYCNKEIYFLKTQNSRLVPVEPIYLTPAEIRDCQENLKRLFIPSRHVPHFKNCIGEQGNERDN